MEEKKSWASTLLEKVFGKFGKTSVEASKTRRRCWRCRVRYDKTKIKGDAVKVVDGLGRPGEPLVPSWNTDRFCSKACADTSPSYSEGTRQSRYFSFLQDATTETRRRFYSGRNGVSWPDGMSRRNARRVMRGVARKALREIR
jgi:hypothetical protein